MADAKKCDRCGNLYETYIGLKLRDNSSFYYECMCLVTKGGTYTHYDLCPDCMAALISFIKQGEKKC